MCGRAGVAESLLIRDSTMMAYAQQEHVTSVGMLNGIIAVRMWLSHLVCRLLGLIGDAKFGLNSGFHRAAFSIFGLTSSLTT